MTEYFTTKEIIAGSVSLIVLMFLGIIGNVLTCLIVCKKPSFRTSTNTSILSLSISDISMASLVMPFSLASLIKEKWIFLPEACTFNAVLFHSLLGVSLTTMTCTAVIRYLCVVKPSLHRRYAKPKLVAVGISVIWFINFTLQLMYLSASSGYGFYSPKQIYCLYLTPKKGAANAINYSGLIIAVLLGLLMFMAYFKVFRFVSHHNQTVASNLQQENPSHVAEARITKTLVIVTLGFVACWVPVAIVYFIMIVGVYNYHHFKVPSVVFLFQTICIFASSAINPFIFAFTNRQFRKGYFELLRCLLPLGAKIVPAEDL